MLETHKAAIARALLPVLWVVALLCIGISLLEYRDSIVLYQNRTAPQAAELESISFKILQASATTPNFKVELQDGTTRHLSFPNLLSWNPKGGLTFPQVTSSDRKQLSGCMATARIKSIRFLFLHEFQVWDLACESAGIHYGVEIAGSNLSDYPLFDLIYRLFFASTMLLAAVGAIVVGRTLSNRIKSSSLPD